MVIQRESSWNMLASWRRGALAMTKINEIAEKHPEHLERLRGEILKNVDSRNDQETAAINRLVTYMGIVCSGSTIAILGYISQQLKSGVPLLSILALGSFVAAAMSLAACLYWQFQIHSKRWAVLANISQAFFTREADFEDVLEGMTLLQSKWPYRILFWAPFTLLTIGFVLSATSIMQSSSSESKVLAQTSGQH